MPKGVTVTLTAISINSTGLFHPPNGDVWEFYEKMAREFKGLAKGLAPPRRSAAKHGTWATGAMQRSIFASSGAIGTKTIEVDVGTSSEHAQYVLQGTASQGRMFIYTDLGWANKAAVDEWIKFRQFQFEKGQAGLVMPVTRIPGRTRYLLRVKGQRANPFLTDAYVILRQRHSSLPRIKREREFVYAKGGV